jgi:hypothetical protein
MSSGSTITASRPGAAHAPMKITLRNGGWVLIVAGILTILFGSWVAWRAVLWTKTRPPGDGDNPASYAFNLSNSQIPLERIAAGYYYRDMVAALTDPPTMPGADMAEFNQRARTKYLVSDDRVIGVSVGGKSRAYPLMILNCHEIINDTLGGVPIAVTYSPLCDSAVVFDRRVGGEALTFGVSGLFHNSNMLMFERRADGQVGGESLWSQLQARAISGDAAAAGQTLVVLPAALTVWSDWVARHPETTVLRRDERMIKRYKQTNYAPYFNSPRYVLPVEPLPPLPPNGLEAKSRVVIVTIGGERRVWPIQAIQQRAEENGVMVDRIGGVAARFELVGAGPTRSAVVSLETADAAPGAQVMYALWFAWHAQEPDTVLPR